MDRRIPRAYITNIAFEVLYVYWIESSNGGVQANVCLGDLLAKVEGVRMLGQVGFSPVKCTKQRLDGFFVAFLCATYRLSLSAGRKRGLDLRSESSFVHAIIDVVICPIIGLLNLFLQIHREQIHVLKLFGKEVVEFCVKHSYNLTRLIMDD